jgi:hypothetical protein
MTCLLVVLLPLEEASADAVFQKISLVTVCKEGEHPKLERAENLNDAGLSFRQPYEKAESCRIGSLPE